MMIKKVQVKNEKKLKKMLASANVADHEFEYPYYNGLKWLNKGISSQIPKHVKSYIIIYNQRKASLGNLDRYQIAREIIDMYEEKYNIILDWCVVYKKMSTWLFVKPWAYTSDTRKRVWFDADLEVLKSARELDAPWKEKRQEGTRKIYQVRQYQG